MKIILSRKGFDSSNGGCASPILPDGSLLSMPIPGPGYFKFSDFQYNGITYYEIWKQLNPNGNFSNQSCHLDPDIRKGTHVNEIKDWKPAFGQISAAQSHLENKGVDIGDVFLFFGWFKSTEYNHENKLAYKKDARDLHIIYGYMQIGEILRGNEIKKYRWHPHALDEYRGNNTLYIPKEYLNISDGKTDIPGYGIFPYKKSLVLTKEGMSRSKWDLPDYFKDVPISYHEAKSFKDGYFQSALKGQEFVISDNPENEKWLMKLLS